MPLKCITFCGAIPPLDPFMIETYSFYYASLSLLTLASASTLSHRITYCIWVLHLLGREAPKTANPHAYIRFVYNRVILETTQVWQFIRKRLRYNKHMLHLLDMIVGYFQLFITFTTHDAH